MFKYSKGFNFLVCKHIYYREAVIGRRLLTQQYVRRVVGYTARKRNVCCTSLIFQTQVRSAVTRIFPTHVYI